MSIEQTLQSIATHVGDIYTKISSKGGTVPINKNLVNVPDAIDTISAGGGGSANFYKSMKPTLDYVEPTTLTAKIWTGLTNFDGSNVWTDGVNIYYSYQLTHYVLDVTTSTWATKTWSGDISAFYGSNIWTDGTNIYYSYGNIHCVLDVATSTWAIKTWNNMPSSFDINGIWTDGTNIYYSNINTQLVLDVATSTWNEKVWTGFSSLYGGSIWTDGTNIYYSSNTNQYVLDVTTSTWNEKTWTVSGGGSFNGNGQNIFTDGVSIYFMGGVKYVLDKATDTWNSKTWTGYSSFYPQHVWTDGANVYVSNNANQYVFNTKKLSVRPQLVK